MEDMNAAWTHDRAVELCRRIEQFAPDFHCHVALTGGALYKDGPRKGCDILFYKIRQAPAIDKDGLFDALDKIGLYVWANYGWCCKATYGTEYMTQDVDLFFPDQPTGGPMFDQERAGRYITDG